MGRHKNPRYNRKRLVTAGIAAVTMLGVAVGIGVYGSAFADQPAPAASQECLPPGGATTAPPAPPTTTDPPSETAPPEDTAPPADSGTETAPPADTATDTQTETAPPSDSDTATEPPADTQTEEPTQGNEGDGDMNLAGDKMLSLDGRPRGGQPTEPSGGAGAADYSGPKPAEQPPAAPAGAAETKFNAPNCVDQLGPAASDFIDIRKVRPSSTQARPGRGASRGTFVSECGRNENNHNNPANFIVAPGNANGAHHLHDYVGNLSADGNSTNESLVAAGTTCRKADQSTYYWPVIRVRNKNSKADETNPHNVGDVQKPASVTLQFSGNAKTSVVAAPQFIRIITGDAKAFANGGANANSAFSCSGFANRVTTKYPLCPRNSRMTRTLVFPSCWDGTNTDSANHRTHIAFPDKNGTCAAGTKAVPKLTMTLTYNLPRGKVFALDAFEDQQHSPITDHGDFVNVMPEKLMNQVVNCINSGRRC